MSFDELMDRLRYRLQGYFYSEKKSVKYFARLLAFSLFAAVISTIAPTLADELSSDPAMLQPVAPSTTESSTVTISESVTPSADPTFSPEPQISRPAISQSSASPLPESSDSATADGPGIPLEVQPKYTLRIPSSAPIDPRATTRFMAHIYASQDDPDVEFTMVCISGAGLAIDAKVKKAADNQPEGEELIAGDLSGNLIISASTNRAINLINSYNALLVSSSGGGLAGRSLTYRFVAVTKPVVNPEFCGAARSGAITTFRALGLDLSTVKGGGKLK